MVVFRCWYREPDSARANYPTTKRRRDSALRPTRLPPGIGTSFRKRPAGRRSGPSVFPRKSQPIVDFGQPAEIKRRPSVARYRNQSHGSKLEQRFGLRRRPGGANGWKDRAMTLLRWALLFFLISIVAGILGFTDISAASADIPRFLFYVFLVTFPVLLIPALTIFRI